MLKRLLTYSRQTEAHNQIMHWGKTIDDVPHILARTISKLITIEANIQGDLWHIEADPHQEVFRAHHEEIDLVLLDLVMPKMDGERVEHPYHGILAVRESADLPHVG